MAPSTPRRVSLPPVLANRKGQRIQVPEGGELVCYQNENDKHLYLIVEYSRETMLKLSSSILCHQRPSGLKQVAEEMPELLGLPQPIPLTSSLPNIDESILPLRQLRSIYPFVPSSMHLFSPIRGPVTEADETMRTLSNHRELQKRLQNMSLHGAVSPSECLMSSSEMTSMREIRNPQFT